MTQLEDNFNEGNWVRFNDSTHTGPEKYKKLTAEEAEAYNLSSPVDLEIPEKVDEKEVEFYYTVKIVGYNRRIENCKPEEFKKRIVYQKELEIYEALLEELEKKE